MTEPLQPHITRDELNRVFDLLSPRLWDLPVTKNPDGSFTFDTRFQIDGETYSLLDFKILPVRIRRKK